MSRTVCPACRQRHGRGVDHGTNFFCVAVVTVLVAWVVLVVLVVAAVVG